MTTMSKRYLPYHGDQQSDYRAYLLSLKPLVADVLRHERPILPPEATPEVVLAWAMTFVSDDIENGGYEVFNDQEAARVLESLRNGTAAQTFETMWHGCHLFVGEYNRDVDLYGDATDQNPWSMDWVKQMTGPQTDLVVLAALLNAALALPESNAR